MPASTEPRSGLHYGWNLGENGWPALMNSNLLLLGRYGFHLSVKDRDLTTPPGSPTTGDAYIPATGATGAWSGKATQVALWDGAAWVFGVPRTGWVAVIEDEEVSSTFKGTTWSAGIPIAPRTAVFASLPSPASAYAQVWTASDAGPDPGIQLVSNGSRWRPCNGIAVLASRAANPITIQNTAGAVAETLGPFPGGLVRAGMLLEIDYRFNYNGIGTAARGLSVRIGNGATRNEAHAGGSLATSGTNLLGRISVPLSVLSDTSAAHPAGSNSNSTFFVGGGNTRFPTVDFSQDWSVDFFLTSCNETAVSITGATWAAGVATFTCATHTLALSDKTTVAGVTPAGWNGVFTLGATPANANTFTVPMAVDPGAYTSGGTSSRISNMVLSTSVLTLKG